MSRQMTSKKVTPQQLNNHKIKKLIVILLWNKKITQKI